MASGPSSVEVSYQNTLIKVLEEVWRSEFKVLRKVVIVKCRACGVEICLLCMLRFIKKIDQKGYTKLIKETLKQCK